MTTHAKWASRKVQLKEGEKLRVVEITAADAPKLVGHLFSDEQGKFYAEAGAWRALQSTSGDKSE